MRELELIIDDALKNGLNPKYGSPSNTQALWEALGFRCGRDGLEIFPAGENPLPNTLELFYDWPFPQFIAGERYNFLVVRDSDIDHEDAIYTISDDMSTVSSVFSVDELTFGVGTLMEVADFGEYAMLVNGVVMVFWNSILSAWNASLATATIPLMRTICNFKGQAVGGAVTSTWHDCDETFFIWSKIGEMDFTPDDRNEAGYRRCPFGGTVYHVRRLGDSVIGYSSKGVTKLKPVASPAATFGFDELIDVGLHNRGAIGGNKFHQVFVGKDLVVREVTGEGIKDLGYEHWMDEIGDEDIVVNYDKSRGDFYIGNSSKTFLLSPYGMTEIPQHPSAVWRVDSDRVYMLPDTEDDFYPTISSDIFDMGYRGQKTVSTIETDATPVEDPEASVDCSFDLENWESSNYTPVNNMGIASINVAGGMFRFKLRFGQLRERFRIGYMKIRYKMTDLRGIRGVYAPPPRGQ